MIIGLPKSVHLQLVKRCVEIKDNDWLLQLKNNFFSIHLIAKVVHLGITSISILLKIGAI